MKRLIRVAIIADFSFSLVAIVIGFYNLFTDVQLWWIALAIGAISAFTGLILLLSYRTNRQFKDNRGK